LPRSVTQLATKIDQIMLSSAEVAKAPFAPISIIGSVLADEAMTLFKSRGSMIAIHATMVALVAVAALFASLVTLRQPDHCSE
jgi:hypothetical protein